jgi:hypothetical protein
MLPVLNPTQIGDFVREICHIENVQANLCCQSAGVVHQELPLPANGTK